MSYILRGFQSPLRFFLPLSSVESSVSRQRLVSGASFVAYFVAYVVAHSCLQDDMETILEKLNLLGKGERDRAIMPILFHVVGLESNVQNQDAKEKLALRLVALRLDEGNGFVLQDDVYIKPYPNRFLTFRRHGI